MLPMLLCLHALRGGGDVRWILVAKSTIQNLLIFPVITEF